MWHAALRIFVWALSFAAGAQPVNPDRGFSQAQTVKRTPLVPPQVLKPCTSGHCRFAGQRLRLLVISGEPIRRPFLELKDEFEAATGASLEIESYITSETHARLISDLAARKGHYDLAVISANWLGGLVEGGHLLPYDKFYADPSFPRWNIDDVLPAARRLLSYAGGKYMVADDHDSQLLYYRRDLLADPRHDAEFRRRYGYGLAPPQTWAQLHDMAEYFGGQDLDGDGQPDWGIVLPPRIGTRYFLSLSAPFVIGPRNPARYWFDPQTMTPLIDSPGHVRALEVLLALVRLSPRSLQSWSQGRGWDEFLAGRVAFALTWGDLGGLAQLPGSRVRGQLGTAPLPGTQEYYDPGSRQWIKAAGVNRVGNTVGGSWAGVISRYSKQPQAAYFLLALKAAKDKALVYAARGWDGVDPGRRFQLLPPEGNATAAPYLDAGWSEADLPEYLHAIGLTLGNPLQAPYLRLPGAVDYLEVLNQQLETALAGHLTAQQALRAAAVDFEDITLRFGRDAQRAAYARSVAP